MCRLARRHTTIEEELYAEIPRHRPAGSALRSRGVAEANETAARRARAAVRNAELLAGQRPDLAAGAVANAPETSYGTRSGRFTRKYCATALA